MGEGTVRTILNKMEFFKKKNIEDGRIIEQDLRYITECFELVKNLISMESHAIQSYLGTKKEFWLEKSKKIRELRTKYLEKVINEIPDSQFWCFSKHIAECLMRLQELATRHISNDDIDGAKDCLKDLDELSIMFFEMNNYGKKY